MVYELFFRATDGEISLEMFQNYFKGYPHYEVSGPDAFYKNQNTGIYFSFHYLHMNGEDNENVRPEGTYRISMEVSYCVPSIFIKEALIEVEALIEATKVVMYDPQPCGVGLKGYDHDKMLACWQEHNEYALQDMAKSNVDWDDEERVVVPDQWIERVWAWNYDIPLNKKAMGDDIDVPIIFALFDGEDTKSGIVWKNGCAIAMPKVEIIIIAKSDPKTGSLVYCPVAHEDVVHLIAAHHTSKHGETHILAYEDVPDDIQEFVTNAQADDTWRRLPMDQVLEEDAVENAFAE